MTDNQAPDIIMGMEAEWVRVMGQCLDALLEQFEVQRRKWDLIEEEEAALSTHEWERDEGSAGVAYEYCILCRRDKADCLPNEYQGAIACEEMRNE